MTHQDPDTHTPQQDHNVQGRTVPVQPTRQGRPGVRILWVLLVALAAVAILFAVIYAFSQRGLSDTNANDGDQAVDAQAFQGDSQTAPAADAPTSSTGEAQPAPTGETPNVNAPTVPSN